jgi:hypothetical protein
LAKPIPDITPEHFRELSKYHMRRNSAANPSRNDYDFIDYAPRAFAALRALYGIDQSDYLVWLARRALFV